MSGTIIRGAQSDHRCEPPDPINRGFHDTQEAHFARLARESWVKEQEFRKWAGLPWYRRLFTPRPEGGWPGLVDHHTCYEECRAFLPGTIWECGDCGLRYQVNGVTWNPINTPENPRVRAPRTPHDQDTLTPGEAFVAGFIL